MEEEKLLISNFEDLITKHYPDGAGLKNEFISEILKINPQLQESFILAHSAVVMTTDLKLNIHVDSSLFLALHAGGINN